VAKDGLITTTPNAKLKCLMTKEDAEAMQQQISGHKQSSVQ